MLIRLYLELFTYIGCQSNIQWSTTPEVSCHTVYGQKQFNCVITYAAFRHDVLDCRLPVHQEH